jgi:hypothetical protein
MMEPGSLQKTSRVLNMLRNVLWIIRATGSLDDDLVGTHMVVAPRKVRGMDDAWPKMLSKGAITVQ